MPRSLATKVVSTPTAQVLPRYDIYFTDTTVNPVTLTLPAIDGDDGLHFYFRNINDGIPDDTTILPADGDTIDGQSSYVLFTGTFNHFVSLGTNWYIIG